MPRERGHRRGRGRGGCQGFHRRERVGRRWEEERRLGSGKKNVTGRRISSRQCQWRKGRNPPQRLCKARPSHQLISTGRTQPTGARVVYSVRCTFNIHIAETTHLRLEYRTDRERATSHLLKAPNTRILLACASARWRDAAPRRGFLQGGDSCKEKPL